MYSGDPTKRCPMPDLPTLPNAENIGAWAKTMWLMYDNLTREGFTEAQALVLLSKLMDAAQT